MNSKDWDNIYQLVGAAYTVYNTLGKGLLEPIYQKAYEIELDLLGIPYTAQQKIDTYYKGHKLPVFYKADIYSNGIIVELKAISKIIPECRAQLFNYMRLTKTDIGILINFGEDRLRSERYLFDHKQNDFILLKTENYSEHLEL